MKLGLVARVDKIQVTDQGLGNSEGEVTESLGKSPRVGYRSSSAFDGETATKHPFPVEHCPNPQSSDLGLRRRRNLRQLR